MLPMQFKVMRMISRSRCAGAPKVAADGGYGVRGRRIGLRQVFEAGWALACNRPKPRRMCAVVQTVPGNGVVLQLRTG